MRTQSVTAAALVISLLMAPLMVRSLPAQAEEASPSFRLTGSIGMALRSQDAVLTFGGPRLAVSSEEFQLSAGFFPSLLYLQGQSPGFRPSLGFGPELSYKKVGVVIPFYYVRNRTVPFVGLSFKF